MQRICDFESVFDEDVLHNLSNERENENVNNLLNNHAVSKKWKNNFFALIPGRDRPGIIFLSAIIKSNPATSL